MSEAFTVVCDQTDRAAWLAERRKGLGGSDAPATLGLSKFASPLSVAVSKLGLEKDGEESELLAWGREVEGPMIAKFSRDSGRKVELDGRLLRSNSVEWMLATLDGRQWSDEHEGPGVCECKLAMYSSDDWKQGIPESVEAQVQHQIAVTGFGWGSALVLLDGYKLRFEDVVRDDDFILNRLVPAERELWDRIQRSDLDGLADDSEATTRALKALYKEAGDAHTVELGGDFTALHLRRLDLKARAKDCEAELRGIDNEIKEAIGTATFGELPNGVIYSLKTQTRRETVQKASTFRVLRVVGGGK